MNRLPEILNLRKDLGALATCWFVQAAAGPSQVLTPDSYELPNAPTLHMLQIGLTIEEVLRQKMEQWDRDCENVPDDPAPDVSSRAWGMENMEYSFALNWSSGSSTIFLCHFYPAG